MTDFTPNPRTATIWLSPYRITYRTNDNQLTGSVNKPSADLIQKTLSRLYAFLIIEGYSPDILHEEH